MRDPLLRGKKLAIASRESERPLQRRPAAALDESAGYSHRMPDGHAPFALWNRTGNRAVELLLRSAYVASA